MTNIETIRTIIEQKKEAIKAELDNPINPYVGLENLGRWRMCDELLSSISTFGEEQKEWKPSEEQLNALNFAITYFMHETNYKNPTELRELYDDLLKLK